MADDAGKDDIVMPGHGELTDGEPLDEAAPLPTPPASELKPAPILPPISPIDGRADVVSGVLAMSELRFAVSELPAAVEGADVIANKLLDIDCFAEATSTDWPPLSGDEIRALRSADIDELADDPPE